MSLSGTSPVNEQLLFPEQEHAFPYGFPHPSARAEFFISSQMTRTNVGLIVTAAVLGILLIGGWVVWLVLPAHSTQTPAAETVASSTSETATSSAALPPPEPTPTYAQQNVPAAQVTAGTAPVATTKTAAALATTATLVVDGTRFPLHAAAGSTLEAAMSQLQSEGGFTYATKHYGGLGSFVTEINGRAGGGTYWIFYVNGEQSQTGISSTRIRSGDVIEWKLEKSY
jgi:hypothetical protein